MKLIFTIVLLLNVVESGAVNQTIQSPTNLIKSNETKNSIRYDLTQKIMQENVTGDSVTGDNYGYSVDIDDTYAIVGAPNSYGSGKVYIYHNNGTDWVLEQSILPKELNQNKNDTILLFGKKVFIENGRAIIFTNYINSTDSFSIEAVIYIFHKVGNKWVYEDKIDSNDVNNQLGFQFSAYELNMIGYSNQKLIIAGNLYNNSKKSYGLFAFEYLNGQWQHSSTISILDTTEPYGIGALNLYLDNDKLIVGNPYDGDNNQGSVYIYEFDGAIWNSSISISPSLSNPNDYFGSNVTIQNNKALIQSSVSGQVAIYYFELVNSTWIEKNIIYYHPDDTYVNFGNQIKIFENKAMIAVESNRYTSDYKNNFLLYRLINNEWILDENTNINLNTSSFSFASSSKIILGDIKGSENASGSVFIFNENNASSWDVEKQFDRPIRSINQHFGRRLSVEVNNALIATYKYIPRLLPPTLDNIVFAFKKSGNNWIQTQKIIPPEPSYEFGGSISLEEDTAVISAPDLEKVYVYKLINNNWELVATLTDDTNQSRVFGLKAILKQNKILVIAYDETGFENSSLHIFENIANTWVQTLVITYPFRNSILLETSIDFSGDSIAVINFDEIENRAVLFSYDFDGTNWIQSENFIFVNTKLFNASSLSMTKDRIVVTTFNLPLSTNVNSLSIFEKLNNSWQYTETLELGDNFDVLFTFNYAPLVSDINTIAISSIPPALPDNRSNNNVTVFSKNNNTWQSEIVTNNGINYTERFAHFIELNNSELFISIPYDDENGGDAGALNVYNQVDVDLIFINSFE